jgi:hypothetical protein
MEVICLYVRSTLVKLSVHAVQFDFGYNQPHYLSLNPLNAELNPIRHLLALE